MNRVRRKKAKVVTVKPRVGKRVTRPESTPPNPASFALGLDDPAYLKALRHASGGEYFSNRYLKNPVYPDMKKLELTGKHKKRISPSFYKRVIQ